MHYVDPYSKNVFTNGFEASAPDDSTQPIALMTAFKVAEHFSDPIKDFGRIFEYNPQTLLFSTWLYEDQDTDWWYFTPDGQHVSLYTKKSLAYIAKLYGYECLTYKNLHLFTRHKLSARLRRRIRKRTHQKVLVLKKKYQSKTVADHHRAIANAEGSQDY